jgi:hypothetical protein
MAEAEGLRKAVMKTNGGINVVNRLKCRGKRDNDVKEQNLHCKEGASGRILSIMLR